MTTVDGAMVDEDPVVTGHRLDPPDTARASETHVRCRCHAQLFSCK